MAPLLCLTLLLAQIPASRGAVPTPHYDLRIRLQPDSTIMRVEGTLSFGGAPSSRELFRLRLRPEMDSLVATVLSPARSGGLASVKRRSAADGSVTWDIVPREPIPSGDSVVIRIGYRSVATHGFLLGFSDSVMFAGAAWYPKYGDGLVTARLSFEMPASFAVIATGIRQTDTTNPRGSKTIEYVTSRPSELAFAAGRYVESLVAGRLSFRLFQLRSRVDSALVTRLQKTVDVLAREFGPLPSAAMGIAEVPAGLAGAAGFDGASMDGFLMVTPDYLDKPFNLGFFAHELGHQWWGNAIRQRGDSGKYMLDEAMAQYGALRAVETLEGSVSARDFRRFGYPEHAYTHGLRGYMQLVVAGHDYPLAALPDTGYFAQVSHDLADAKGFLVLDLLSRTVGRKAFQEALRSFVTLHNGSAVTLFEWMHHIEGATHRDLTWFWNQWYRRPGLPEFSITWTQSSTYLSGDLIQTGHSAFRASVPLAVEYDNGETAMQTVEVTSLRTPVRIRIARPVRMVTVDPEHLIPRWTPLLRAEAEATGASTQAYIALAFRGDPASAQHILESALTRIVEPDLFASRSTFQGLLGTLALEQGRVEEARRLLDAAVRSPSRSAESLPWFYVRLVRASLALGDTVGARDAARDALTADAVAGRRTGASALIRQQYSSLLMAPASAPRSSPSHPPFLQ